MWVSPGAVQQRSVGEWVQWVSWDAVPGFKHLKATTCGKSGAEQPSASNTCKDDRPTAGQRIANNTVSGAGPLLLRPSLARTCGNLMTPWWLSDFLVGSLQTSVTGIPYDGFMPSENSSLRLHQAADALDQLGAQSGRVSGHPGPSGYRGTDHRSGLAERVAACGCDTTAANGTDCPWTRRRHRRAKQRAAAQRSSL